MKRERLARKNFLWARILLFIAVASVWVGLVSSQACGAPDSAGCSTNSESRKLDFWLGDWSVTYAGAPDPSSSKVSLELGRCVVMEKWGGGKGHQGINLFAYSADDQHWHGMFADNEGRVHVFEGKAMDGRVEFLGSSRGANGETDLNRIRVVRVGPDEVEQTWEKSADNGAKWTTVFRGEYSRKKD